MYKTWMKLVDIAIGVCAVVGTVLTVANVLTIPTVVLGICWVSVVMDLVGLGIRKFR